MAKPDPDKLEGPGGLTLRQIHTQVKQSAARDSLTITQNRLSQSPSRWQRFVRYVWDNKRGKS